MRRFLFIVLPVLALLLISCNDQTMAPDLEVTAVFKKPSKPPKPPPPPADALEFISIETSFRPLVGAFTCGVTNTDIDGDDVPDGVGPVYCWGNNSHYSLGLGGKKKTDKKTPTEPAGGEGFIFSEVHLGNLFACAIEDPDGNGQGPVFCWGQNAHGELGDGTTKLRSSPTQIASSLEFSALDAGGSEACAVAAQSGHVYCWGGSSTGYAPVRVWDDLAFSSVAVGTWGTVCGLQGSSGDLWCWHGEPWNPATRKMVQGAGSFDSVVSGYGDTCGLATNGTVHCWVVEGDGEITDPIIASEIAYGAASGEGGFTSISAGFCGIGNNTGQAYCWGRNDDGQVGDGSEPTGTVTVVEVPTAVSTPSFFSKIGEKNFHTCGIASDGFAYCWGSNGSGELGVGTLQDSSVPVKVAGQ